MTGASHLIFDIAEAQGWILQTSSFVLSEVEANLSKLAPDAARPWDLLRGKLRLVPDVVSFPWVTVFAAAKDRPVLFTAVAWADVLLTLDRRDFGDLLGRDFYGLIILKPGDFLSRERLSGRWL
jgi:hypothetical protein